MADFNNFLTIINKIYTKRILFITIWNSSIQFFLLSLLFTFSNAGNGMFSFLLWIISTLLCVILNTVLSDFIHLSTYNKCATATTRYQNISNLFSPTSIIVFVLHIFKVILLLFYLRTVLMFDVSNECNKLQDNVNTCIQQKNYAVLVACVCVMIISFFKITIKNHQMFLPMHERNFSVVVYRSTRKLKKAMFKSFPVSVTIVLSYILLRFIYSIIFESHVNLFITFSLLFQIFVVNTWILFENMCIKFLFHLYLMEYIKFPVNPEGGSIVLKEAMASNVLILKHQGYYDFSVSCEFDQQRRLSLLALSIPGGHPYIWKAILQETLALIDTTTTELDELTTPVKYNQFVPRNILHPVITREHNIINKQSRDIKFKGWISNWINSFRIVRYLLHECREKKINVILSNARILSFACYGLSSLASSSVFEDKYGVLQEDIPKIITSLLNLKRQLKKLDVHSVKHLRLLHKCLNSAVTSSLYKFAISFKSYFKELNLTPNDKEYFRKFVLFKEM